MAKRSSPVLLPRQIREYIAESIRDGVLEPNSPVPSQRSLCDKFGVCRATVTSAFKELLRDGLVYQVQGKGTYVAEPAQVAEYFEQIDQEQRKGADRGVTPLTMVALLVPYDTEQESRISDDLFLQIILDEARRVLLDRDHALKVCFVKNEPEAYERLRLGADGLLVLASRVDRGYVRYCRQARQAATVVIGRVFKDERLHSVAIDYAAAGRSAIDYLIDLGHKEIGCIKGPANHYAGIELLKGVAQSMDRAAIALRPEWAVEGDYTEAGGRRAIKRMLASGRLPTAVFASSDEMAFGAMEVLAQRGVRVPDDVSILGLNDSPAAATVEPPLTTIRQPTCEMARLAAETIADLIEGKRDTLTREVLETILVERGSCRPV